MHLNYVRGVDILEDTIDVALHFGYITNASAGWYVVMNPDAEGEVMLDENGKPIKVQGRKKLKTYFEEHKAVWKKLYTKIYEKLEKKEDNYVAIFNEMLDADIEEKFGVDLAKEQADD